MSAEVYIFTLTSINVNDINDRVSFSKTITSLMPENILDSEKKEFEKGYTIRSEEEENNQIFTTITETLKKTGYWSPWMQNWTSATIYLLYQGETSV
ncbi:MAG: hypothetical protein WC877_00055 [Dehalococcoidales bacterium]|jgi:hypothetical protein